MTTDPNAPDAALLWARERWPHDGAGFHNSAAEAFRAGQAHERRADAGLLAALELAANRLNRLAVNSIAAGDPHSIEHSQWVQEARAAITAAKGHDHAEG